MTGSFGAAVPRALQLLSAAFGFRAYALDLGAPGLDSHAVTLIQIRHETTHRLVVQDAYFNQTYVDEDGQRLDLFSACRLHPNPQASGGQARSRFRREAVLDRGRATCGQSCGALRQSGVSRMERGSIISQPRTNTSRDMAARASASNWLIWAFRLTRFTDFSFHAACRAVAVIRKRSAVLQTRRRARDSISNPLYGPTTVRAASTARNGRDELAARQRVLSLTGSRPLRSGTAWSRIIDVAIHHVNAHDVDPASPMLTSTPKPIRCSCASVCLPLSSLPRYTAPPSKVDQRNLGPRGKLAEQHRQSFTRMKAVSPPKNGFWPREPTRPRDVVPRQAGPNADAQYRAFVGNPSEYDWMGAYQFDYLIGLGLREHHYLLDIGCGSLRGGRLFIPYLLPGRYFGIEPNNWLLTEGFEHELGRDILDIKEPTFLIDDAFRSTKFELNFDYIIAQSVFSHAAGWQISQCLSEVRRCMTSSSVFAATFLLGDEDYQGTEWLYPDCSTYTWERIEHFATAEDLRAVQHELHPYGQQWVVFMLNDPKNDDSVRALPPRINVVSEPASEVASGQTAQIKVHVESYDADIEQIELAINEGAGGSADGQWLPIGVNPVNGRAAVGSFVLSGSNIPPGEHRMAINVHFKGGQTHWWYDQPPRTYRVVAARLTHPAVAVETHAANIRQADNLQAQLDQTKQQLQYLLAVLAMMQADTNRLAVSTEAGRRDLEHRVAAAEAAHAEIADRTTAAEAAARDAWDHVTWMRATRVWRAGALWWRANQRTKDFFHWLMSLGGNARV